MLHQVYSVQIHLDVCSVPIQADDLCPLLKGSSRPSSATGKKAGVVTAVPRSKTVRHQRYDQGLGNVRAVPCTRYSAHSPLYGSIDASR